MFLSRSLNVCILRYESKRRQWPLLEAPAWVLAVQRSLPCPGPTATLQGVGMRSHWGQGAAGCAPSCWPASLTSLQSSCSNSADFSMLCPQPPPSYLPPRTSAVRVALSFTGSNLSSQLLCLMCCCHFQFIKPPSVPARMAQQRHTHAHLPHGT